MFLNSGRTIDSKTINLMQDDGKVQIKKNIYKLVSQRDNTSMNLNREYMDKPQNTDKIIKNFQLKNKLKINEMYKLNRSIFNTPKTSIKIFGKSKPFQSQVVLS